LPRHSPRYAYASRGKNEDNEEKQQHFWQQVSEGVMEQGLQTPQSTHDKPFQTHVFPDS